MKSLKKGIVLKTSRPVLIGTVGHFLQAYRNFDKGANNSCCFSEEYVALLSLYFVKISTASCVHDS